MQVPILFKNPTDRELLKKELEKWKILDLISSF